jgi:hypothetical protein
MSIRIACAAALLAAYSPTAQLCAQGTPTGVVGWYNGDWRPAIPGATNWHATGQQFAHVYDDFVVPAGGWTVAGVFAHLSMRTGAVTQAFWEIRSGVSSGDGGVTVASGIGAATMTKTGTVGGGQDVYLIQVNGLWTTLAAGRYWLSVAPVTQDTQSYLCKTLGDNAVGEPKGVNGESYGHRTTDGAYFTPHQGTGQGGTSADHSLGVILSGAPTARESAWQANLAWLTGQMSTLHSLPFPGISAENFARQSTDLASRVADLSDAEVRTALQALVASIGDPHTDVIWPNPRPFRSLPLAVYWFDDGLYVVAAPERYRSLLGGKIVTIGKTGIDDAIAKLTPLTPHDNDSWLKQVIPANKLTNADFLYGTRIADSTAAVDVQTRTASGELRTVTVDAVDGGPSQPMIPVFQGELPLYRRHPERRYWATPIDGGAAVYFQYNGCAEDARQPSAEFFAELDRLLSQPEVDRLVVDLRNNSGGLTGILNPWFERIKSSRFNQPGRLYVIVGRATYSAAMEHSNRFREETAAIFVGEPTGAKPRFLLRRGDFGLPYFGIRVSYSNGIERAADPGPTLIPDICVPVTFKDYMRGIDPALDAILAKWRRTNLVRKQPRK